MLIVLVGLAVAVVPAMSMAKVMARMFEAVR
jgi:hypothetical protein